LTELAAKLKATGFESIKSQYYEGGHFSRTVTKPEVQLMGRWTGA
jgi:hypothetical protein